MGWIGSIGHRATLFLVKNCWTLSAVWAGAPFNHPSWNGQTHWKNLQKKFTEAEHSLSQHHQLVHWYRWVPRTLARWGSLYYKGPTLQKVIPVLWGAPPRMWTSLSPHHDDQTICILTLKGTNPYWQPASFIYIMGLTIPSWPSQTLHLYGGPQWEHLLVVLPLWTLPFFVSFAAQFRLLPESIPPKLSFFLCSNKWFF